MSVCNILLSRIGLPILEHCSRTQFWTVFRQMRDLRGSDDSTIAVHQESKLTLLLNSAYNDTNFWQNQLTKGTRALSSIEVTNKQTYAQGFPDDVTSAGGREDWQYLSSAGTTGRMTVVVDFTKRDYLRAAEHLNLSLATGDPIGCKSIDIPPSACNVVCGMEDEGPEPIGQYIWWATKNKKLFNSDILSNLRGRIERQILLKRQLLLPLDSAPWEVMTTQLDSYLNLIQANKIQIVRALPHFLLWLAKRAEQRKMTLPNLHTLLPYGGLAGDALITRIEQALDAKFVNVYGTGEVGSIGCESKHSNNLEIYSDMVCLEVLDENFKPVAKGQMGKVVVTDLNNFAMPIIRYAIGDIAQVVEVNKHNGLPKKIKVLGREQESLKTANDSYITALQIQNCIFDYDDIINFKIDMLSRHIVKLSVVALDNFDEEKLAGEIQSLLCIKQKPIIKRVKFLLPESSGKYLSIKQPSV